MSAPRCYALFVALVLAACVCAAPAQEGAATPAKEETPSAENQELALFRDHLFNNKDFGTRVSAATVLLFKEAPAARAVVIEALSQSKNATARAAVCKALDASRTDPRQLKSPEDFLQPLIGLLGTTKDAGLAKLAAETTLMFSYDQLQGALDKLVDNTEIAGAIRSNGVYALQLHPDKRAALKLISLLDNPDSDLRKAAETALTSLGISVGQDAEGRRLAISELEHQGPEAYLRKRLVRSEADIRDLREELGSWQRYYFAALGDWYDSVGDEAARSAFLAGRLKAVEPAVKLWALERLEELKKGTGKPKLSDELKATLLQMVSSKNRQVRLRTARLLALMWELNSAQRLLQQLAAEEDAEVKHELFVALGAACYFASLPTSDVEVPDEVRKETLKWAVRFLNEPAAAKARSGADVIRKLLEQDGLTPTEVDGYLKALAGRYRQAAAAGSDQGLQGELLNAMAGLCGQRSVCRTQAIQLYSPSFEQALTSKAEAVRLAAVDAFMNIDKAAALKRLRRDLVNDPSVSVRARLIDLAGEVGSAEDLDWLVKKIGAAGESEPSWQAMLEIFRRSGAEVAAKWTQAVADLPAKEKLPTDQKVAFFALAEQKAQAEKNAALLREARSKLVSLHVANGGFKQAAEYLELLEKAAGDPKEQEGLLLDRLAVCLRWPNFEMAGQIIQNYLSKKDVTLDSRLAKSLDGFLKEPPAGVDPNALLEQLTNINVPQTEARPVWRQFLQAWTKPVAKAQKPEEVEKTNN